MTKFLLLNFALMLGVCIAIQTQCGFSNDLGICVKTKKCPSSSRKNLTILNEERPIGCLRSTYVCCDQEGVLNKSVPEQKDTTSIDSLSHTRPLEEICGRINKRILDDKISLGTSSSLGEFSWIVGVFRNKPYNATFHQQVFKFAGSLITPKIVLTAAHKVSDVRNIANIFVRAGITSIAWKPNLDKRNVSAAIIHENFNRTSHENNIALLVLTEPFILSYSIGIICIAAFRNEVNLGSKCTVAGWGKTGSSPEDKQQEDLKKVDVDIYHHKRCEIQLRWAGMGKNFNLSDSFLCAIGENGEDTCDGDGGSPLVCPMKNDGEKFVQVGITSWGLGCNRVEVPGVYVNVFKYFNWINDKINAIDTQ